MKRLLGIICLSLLGASAAASSELAPIKDRDLFIDYIDGRDLTIRLYGLTLSVTGNGKIEGRAVGRPIVGTWSWQDGYFCREMIWGTRPIEYNCQLVEASGSIIRFTTDRGTGNYADFRLR